MNHTLISKILVGGLFATMLISSFSMGYENYLKFLFWVIIVMIPFFILNAIRDIRARLLSARDVLWRGCSTDTNSLILLLAFLPRTNIHDTLDWTFYLSGLVM